MRCVVICWSTVINDNAASKHTFASVALQLLQYVTLKNSHINLLPVILISHYRNKVKQQFPFLIL